VPKTSLTKSDVQMRPKHPQVCMKLDPHHAQHIRQGWILPGISHNMLDMVQVCLLLDRHHPHH